MLSYNPWLTLIIWIWCRVVVKIDMHQNGNLVNMPMHTLHFKTIVLCKVNNIDHNIDWEIFNALFEMFIFLSCNKIIFNKVLQFWLQIFNELMWCRVLIHQGQLLQWLAILGHCCFTGKTTPLDYVWVWNSNTRI